ncbi:MAG: hypothetical protein JWN23_2482, partial [Rhodocyclales bacterium]|nr:hypothetical protein [Rhodocyclales bacterium]
MRAVVQYQGFRECKYVLIALVAIDKR